jgi:hypothetical protein
MTSQRPIVPLKFDPDAVSRNAVTSLVRASIATALAKFDKSTTPSAIAKRTWDDRAVDMILRAASSPATLCNTPTLATVAVAFLDSLVPVSAGADLLERSIGLNFSGAASISIPAVQVPTADFVAEGSPIPVVTAPTSIATTLTPFKLAVITTLTHEMLVNANAETLVRQALIESTGPALDKVLFSAAAGIAHERPAGLLNGITLLTPSAAGGQSKGEVLVDDLQQLASAVAPVAGNGDIVLVASPDAATALRMRLPVTVQWPVLVSTSLPAKTVIAIATQAIVSAIGGAPQIDASGQVELVRDTAPTAIDDALTAPMQLVGSLYQTDEIALRMRWMISWSLRTPAGIAFMQNVNW